MASGSLKIIRSYEDPFTHIENAILRDKRMSLAERGFFALVLSLPKNREMSIRYFARISGANKETIGKYFQKFEKLGYLRRYRERGDHGTFGATVYEFLTSGSSPCTDLPAPVEPGTAGPAPAEPCTVNPAQKNKQVNNNIPLEPPTGGRRVPERAKWKPERFEAFWEYYRRNVNPANRSAARKAWDKLKPDEETICAIGMALKTRLRTDEEWRRGIGKPHASTYLNGQQWLDTGPAGLPDAAPVAPVRRYTGTRIIDGREVDVYE